MRKVTGYIGALIVVIALMGSILAGYALNINGQSVVVNEYENVTDVSGLYSHTDQKTYIDYNPAANYIGYSKNVTTYSNTSPRSATFREVTGNTSNVTVTISSTTGVSINGTPTGNPQTAMPAYAFICDDFSFYFESSNNLTFWYVGNHISNVSSATITLSYNGVNSNVTVTINGTDYTYADVSLALAYDTTANYDYLCLIGLYDTLPKTVYLNYGEQVIYNTTSPRGIGVGKYWIDQTTGTSIDTSTAVTRIQDIDTNVGEYRISQYKSIWGCFYPKEVLTDTPGLGINYTESNRVNNYIIGYEDIGGTPVTTSSRIDLQNVSTTNYATPNKEWIIANTYYGTEPWTNQLKTGPVYTYNNGYQRTGGYIVYKMSDIITSMGGLQPNTKVVSFSVPQIIGSFSDGSNAVRYTVNNSQYFWSIPYNFVVIGNQPGTYDYDMHQPEQNPSAWTNLYRTAIYDVETGLVNIYDINGAKILTDNISNIYIQSISSPGDYGLNEYHYTNSIQQGTGHYYVQQMPVTLLDVSITTSTAVSSPIYMDITKGVKINPTNATDTVWNNEYENGQMQLLFRAEDTYNTYHNELNISGNSVSIDYTGGRFFISLNGAEPIDVGAWRNILLNIDLLNGNVSVNPVRTFNSYTNVSTDKAVINIGDMVNAAPTTTISWKPTVNSFTFSVYATDVFLNTYGVVMVNPSLTITNYFTDLNNFYRLVLDNFSTYGDSITVNGVTGNVSGNTITFNDETITLKNLEIIYADGHVYVEDDNDSVDLGTIVNNNISLSGVWYFETDLDRGYTALKQIYTWDWTDFILNNTQFCIFYIGMALVGLVVARRFCIMSVIDYAVFITSIIIALSTQVIA